MWWKPVISNPGSLVLPIVLNLRPDPECLVQCNTIILPWIPQNTVNLNKICILWENVPAFYPCYLLSGRQTFEVWQLVTQYIYIFLQPQL